MQPKVVVSAVLVVFGARWWVRRQEGIVPTSTKELPDRVQVFLQTYNLTHQIDAALRPGEVRPGQRDEAPQKRHPVVIVPGITSCGLEVWKAAPCLGDDFFRRRIWGDVTMAEAILSNWSCWLQHITPDPETGLDPEGIKIRAAKGLRSADYFVSGFWLWAKMLQNLADIGYVEDEIIMACYDWRLAFPILEKRDKYFTNLRLDIERAVAHSGEKAVVLGHSMGAVVWFYFMSWVETVHPGWVDNHIASFVNIAGAMLGAMGPMAAYLSGEMEATATLGPMGSYVETLALTFDEMRDIYWAMGGVGALLPLGGTAVWGSAATGWTDTPAEVVSFEGIGDVSPRARTLDDVMAEVETIEAPLRRYPSWTSYFRGAAPPLPAEHRAEEPQRFVNPLAAPLPEAPNMKIFCMYGVGQATERAYRYGFRQARWTFADAEFLPEARLLHWSGAKPLQALLADLAAYLDSASAARPVKIDAFSTSGLYPNVSLAMEGLRRLIEEGDQHPEKWMRINTGFQSNDDVWGNGMDGMYLNGVAHTDGDSTVPLLSLGYMCKNGWRDIKELNPSGIQVWTKEFKHEPTSMLSDPRGGPASAKHVEIIGNTEMIADVLKIVAGHTRDLEQDRIFSNITRIGKVVTKRLRKLLRPAKKKKHDRAA